jgi:hypothetical protein
LTPDGVKVAVFYSKLHNRLLRPLLAADQNEALPGLRAAIRAIDQHVDDYIARVPVGASRQRAGCRPGSARRIPV